MVEKMENLFSSIFSGVSQVIGKLLGHPLDFLSGKSCNTNCKPTWDFICYIENFCISLLLKSALVIVLCYFVLLFLYLSYKLGICQCICHTICRSIRACFGMCFSMIECCCNYFCSKLHNHNQQRRRRRRRHRKRKLRDIEATTKTNYFDEDEGEDDISPQEEGTVGFRHRDPIRFRSRKKRLRVKDESFRRALRPKSHRVHVVSNDSVYLNKKSLRRNGDRMSAGASAGAGAGDHVRVARSSKFARKRGSFKASVHHKRRR